MDGHGLVCQDIEACVDRAFNVLRFAQVVSGYDHEIARLFFDHSVQKIRSAIDLLLPMRRVLGTVVEIINAGKMGFEIVAFGSIDMHDGTHRRVHELLDERGVEMARIEGEQFYFGTHGFKCEYHHKHAEDCANYGLLHARREVGICCCPHEPLSQSG